ncbi:MAG: GreA/GreB family elongation factor [Planctomycetota bacterium]
MEHENLETLARKKNWPDLEQEWLTTIEQPDLNPADLLAVIDIVVSADQADLAATLGWAWLSTMKETHSAKDALQLGRGLLLRLPDGDELREEILLLYRETHSDRPDLDAWIDRSGLKSGKSVRLALRYLETGLRLREGVFLTHRAEDVAAEVVEFSVEDDRVVVKTARRTHTFDVAQLVGEYIIARENDFRVLSQLRPQRLTELLDEDPIALVIGLLACHGNRIDRDELKYILVPHFLPADKWSDWWSKIRNGVKRSSHLRLEGRSPMFLVYDEAGQSLEDEVWTAFSEASTPRECLELLEGYLRDAKQRKAAPDPAFLRRVETSLLDHIERFKKHNEPQQAFAMALVFERLAKDGLPVSGDAHGMALGMLTEAEDPVQMAASLPDARLWALAVHCVEQAFPDKWPELFAELILYGPGSQCDVLAKRVEKAGRGDCLPDIVRKAIAEPGQFTDALLWIWKGPGLKTELPIPSTLEMLSTVLSLVGPARLSEGRNIGQSRNEMRAKVRAGLSAKRYERFRRALDDLDDLMAQTVRRQIERADGLGPRAQDGMSTILYERFPKLYVKPKVEMWEDESVLYFSEDGYSRKAADRDELVNVKMRENAKAIGEAAAHGDLSENSEYKFALEERDLLRARLAQLNDELSLARILSPDDVPADHVGIGQRITLQPTAGGPPVEVSIVGAGDSDLARHSYSYKTPLAAELLGKRKGDVATLALGGQEADYRIERFTSVIQ